jgi:hypothetical protein
MLHSEATIQTGLSTMTNGHNQGKFDLNTPDTACAEEIT